MCDDLHETEKILMLGTCMHSHEAICLSPKKFSQTRISTTKAGPSDANGAAGWKEFCAISAVTDFQLPDCRPYPHQCFGERQQITSFNR